jgi:hypothetical protein
MYAMSVIRFILLFTFALLTRLFYRFEVGFIGNATWKSFRGARVGLVLNHTSLFEPLFVGAVPLNFMWSLASRGVFPAADITANRPIVGRLIKLLATNVVTITRRRDETWTVFMDAVAPNSLILMTPEGRMKRPNGLDKDGKPMTVRGGVVDILDRLKKGRLMIGYSGGLHHVQVPGGGWPKLFKKLAINYEALDIEEYLAQFANYPDKKSRRVAITKDLDRRRDRNCPPEQVVAETVGSNG